MYYCKETACTGKDVFHEWLGNTTYHLKRQSHYQHDYQISLPAEKESLLRQASAAANIAITGGLT